MLGNGDGTFLPGATHPFTGLVPESTLAVGDFNGDGKLDLAVAYGQGIAILLGNGDGTLQAAVDYPLYTATGIVARDFNGDGNVDLAISGLNGVSMMLGRGDGTFEIQPMSFIPSLGAQDAVAGDFNGDGKLDLAVPCVQTNAIGILTNLTP
jgi:hypothetical protein